MAPVPNQALWSCYFSNSIKYYSNPSPLLYFLCLFPDLYLQSMWAWPVQISLLPSKTPALPPHCVGVSWQSTHLTLAPPLKYLPRDANTSSLGVQVPEHYPTPEYLSSLSSHQHSAPQAATFQSHLTSSLAVSLPGMLPPSFARRLLSSTGIAYGLLLCESPVSTALPLPRHCGPLLLPSHMHYDYLLTCLLAHLLPRMHLSFLTLVHCSLLPQHLDQCLATASSCWLDEEIIHQYWIFYWLQGGNLL